MRRAQLLKEIRSRLARVHGERLRGIVLYGSEARGQAGPESDIDLLVLLAGPVRYARDLDLNLEALYPLSLRIGRRISAKPVAADEYEAAETPLYRNAHREGVPV